MPIAPANSAIDVIGGALDAAWGHPHREEAVLQSVRHLSPGEWARLDERERGSGYYRAPRFPATLHSTLAEGWRSFAADGHVREAAVRALASDPHEAANGFLLVRCDDWVDVVRAVAHDAVRRRLRTNALDVEAWMPLILARDERRRAGQLVEACVAASPPTLGERLLAHRDRRTRRWAVRRVLAQSPAAAELERLVETATDPTIARALATKLAALTDDEGLDRLLRDRRAAVRRAAWEQLATGRLPGAELSAGLLDGTPTIRALAQWVARARQVDAGAVYLAAAQRTAVERRRRLVGLGEWGAPEATAVAQMLLGDPDVSVRVAAIDVLALRLEAPGPLLLGLLPHVRGPELGAVRRGLLTNQLRVGDAELAALRTGAPEQRLTAWRLGRARGRWERLVAGLRAVGDPDEALATAARADVDSWAAHLAAEAGRPTPEHRRALEEALGGAGERYRAFVAFLLRA